MNTTLPDDLIDTLEAAKLARTDRKTVVRWAIMGDVIGFKRKRRWFVSRASVLAMFVPAHAPGGPMPPGYHRPAD